jgi:hypothetical protein
MPFFNVGKGLERLLRYCARPKSMPESAWNGRSQASVLSIISLNPGRMGRPPSATPRWSGWIGWPSSSRPRGDHRHRYHGVLAPNAPCVRL